MAIDLIKRVLACCSKVANGDSEAATAFVARFLRRLLRAISIQTSTNTRHPTPEPGQAIEAQPGADAFLGDNGLIADLASPCPLSHGTADTRCERPLMFRHDRKSSLVSQHRPSQNTHSSTSSIGACHDVEVLCKLVKLILITRASLFSFGSQNPVQPYTFSQQ